MNTEIARRNMLTQQIRTCDILDEILLTLLQSTPREAFVPAQFESLAFADTDIPIGHDEYMLNPLLEAKILKALALKPNDTVLEIGTGSAYLTCLMGKLSKQITSLDIHADFLEDARDRLSHHGVHQVELIEANGVEGYAASAPYDVIVYTGSLIRVPENIFDQLKPGGRLFAILGRAPVMEATLYQKKTAKAEGQTISKHMLFETYVKPLQYIRSKRFVF